jgi:hypothetical protein
MKLTPATRISNNTTKSDLEWGVGTAFILACIPAGSLGIPPAILALELALELAGPVTGKGCLAAWTAASGEDVPEE